MHQLALGLAVLVALAIIVIGGLYLSRLRAATLSFGLSLPEVGPNIAWWLRLKGVRDIASGRTVLASMVWGGSHMVGIILLVEAIIPIRLALGAFGGNRGLIGAAATRLAPR